MTCEICNGTTWEITDAGAKRCKCFVPKVQPKGRPITADALSVALRALQAMAFFPTEPAAQMLIGNELRRMCPSVEALQYLVPLAVRRFKTWDKCGLEGLRQALCHGFRPADGIEAGPTEAYPEGLPSEKGNYPLAIPAGAVKALPPGPARDAEDKRLRGLMDRLEVKLKRTPPPNPNLKPITQADVERELERLRDKRARELMREAAGEKELA